MLNLFAVTLDYKALLLLLQKGDDEDTLNFVPTVML